MHRNAQKSMIFPFLLALYWHWISLKVGCSGMVFLIPVPMSANDGNIFFGATAVAIAAMLH
jgi:hypothetical protein